MTDKKYDKKFELDMNFGEALERFSGTNAKEMLDSQKADMPDGTIEDLIDAFEACANQNAEGQQFWYARDMQKLLEYAKWENFEQVITRAMASCEQSNQSVSDHWLPDVRKSISGKGREEDVLDYQMSRYACYLVTQNADPRKRPVAFGQTYFAIQTRRQELSDQGHATAIPMSEDEKRIFIRDQIKEHNKQLSSAAQGAGVITPQEFSIFHSHGYQGLYGMNKGQITRHKGLPKGADILDRMGSTELAANFFRVTQTEEKLRKDNVKGVVKAYKTHYEVGRQVRDAMLKISGIAPEDLPAVDNIKNARSRLKKSGEKSSAIERSAPPQATKTDGLPVVDLKADLWKYALLIMVQKPGMIISTKDLIAELPNYVTIPEDAEKPNSSRKDSKFSQLVRNLKSHKTSKTNFIYQGYATAETNGFRATQKGLDFVLDHFKDRIGRK